MKPRLFPTFRRNTLTLVIATTLAAPFAEPVYATCLITAEDAQLCETREIRFRGDDAAALRAKAAELGNAADIYAYLRNHAEYVPYHGARSDSINTFGGMRGNDVDLASTLIAMLRAQGIKARYVNGRAEVLNSELANWLRMDAGSAKLPFAIQGIDHSDSVQGSGSSSIYATNFSHAWVEALVPYRVYRGAVAASCTQESVDCRWVALDASFKQKHYAHPENRLLLRNLAFDYDAFYNADNPASPKYNANNKNKNPVVIFEETALDYLRQSHLGTTLDDVADPGAIVPDLSGLLPASLPYKATTTARYNSVDDFDVAATAASAKKWSKYLDIQLKVENCGDTTQALPSLHIPMAALTTSRLSFGLVNSNGTRQLGFRLDGEGQGNPVALGTEVQCTDGSSKTLDAATRLDATLTADTVSSSGASVFTAQYPGLVLDGYYLLTNGEETANRAQVQRAYTRLEAANAQYPLLTDSAGTHGPAGEVYVDANGNDSIDAGETALMDHPQARDALTGGLLDVAARLYLEMKREGAERTGLLRNTISYPEASFGLVSTAQAVQYLDSTSFGVTPKGLLIDLKGFKHSNVLVDTATADDATFLFNGHMGSALEHEVWQKVTGLDAISTLRGFQTALQQGQTLLDLRRTASFDPLPGMLDTLGFKTSVPAGFTPATYDLYGRKLYSWVYSGGTPETAGFNLIRANANGVAASVLNSEPSLFTQASNTQGFIKGYDDDENWLLAKKATEGQLKTGLVYDWSDSVFGSADIVKSEVTSPTGFSISAARKTGATNTYTLTLNETANHADGTYTVNTKHYLATTGKSTYDYTTTAFEGYTGTLTSISTNNAAFTVTSNGSSSNVPISSSMPLRLTKGGNLADTDNLVVEVRGTGTIRKNGINYTLTNTPFANVSFIVRNNRVIDQTYTLSLSGLDTSDNLSHTCPKGTVLSGTPTQILASTKTQCFEADITTYKAQGLDIAFYDQNAGFNPALYLYRDANSQSATEHSVGFLKSVQTEIYGKAAGLVEYLFPTRMPYGENYLFNVYLEHVYSADGKYDSSQYAIGNQQ